MSVGLLSAHRSSEHLLAALRLLNCLFFNEDGRKGAECALVDSLKYSRQYMYTQTKMSSYIPCPFLKVCFGKVCLIVYSIVSSLANPLHMGYNSLSEKDPSDPSSQFKIFCCCFISFYSPSPFISFVVISAFALERFKTLIVFV